MKIISVFFAAGLLFSGCAKPSSHDGLAIHAAFSPSPPIVGTDALTMSIKDASGAPVRGAVVDVSSSMPSMSMSMEGSGVLASDNGDGTYTAHLALKYATQWRFIISAKRKGQSAQITLNEAVK